MLTTVPVSQKELARINTDKYGAIIFQTMFPHLPTFTYLIATLLTYHYHKTGMIFMKEFP